MERGFDSEFLPYRGQSVQPACVFPHCNDFLVFEIPKDARFLPYCENGSNRSAISHSQYRFQRISYSFDTTYQGHRSHFSYFEEQAA